MRIAQRQKNFVRREYTENPVETPPIFNTVEMRTDQQRLGTW